MQLILTHENADFDAVAAQLAAHKLYPEATPLLPWRLNRNVSPFLALFWDALPFMRAKEWRRRRVDDVVLVDTQTLPNVRGQVAAPNVFVVDHHTDEALPDGWQGRVEAVGATTTILVEMLVDAGHTLTAEEATLLLLGIYEDTGTLIYETTSERDLRAAAWLLAQGARLDVARRFLDVPFTDGQRALYDALATTVDWLVINGQTIALATAVAPDDFTDEISAIAHRLRDALTPGGLILLVELKHHVQLVARSSNSYVDVAVLARAFGGGGHSRAAAAIVDLTLAEAEARVRELLPEIVAPQVTVADIMSAGVQTVAPTTTVAEAATQMRRSGHEGYPVVDPDSGELLGLLTRRAVDRALSHRFDHDPVRQVMRAGQVTVRPQDDVAEVQRLMIEEGWGQIPVLEDGRLAGIVTRTDVLNLLAHPYPPAAQRDDVRRRLADGLPLAVWTLVQRVGDVADELQMPLYYVGGPVRDLLLEKRPTDVDLVVEGDAIELAMSLADRFGGDVRSHDRFGTAKWRLTRSTWAQLGATPDGESPPPRSVDFVTARTEFYTRPTALPQVEQSSIKLDLHRRDFTINTLAIRLDGAHLGQLLDFYGGQRDLTMKRIRVLHSLSFVDDPTRILRAVRFERRLGFIIEPQTAELLADALPLLQRVSGDRIRHEIELALREPAPALLLARLAELDILRHIHPTLTWSTASADAFGRVPALLERAPWAGILGDESPAFVYFALWMLAAEAPEEIMLRLKVRKRTRLDVGAARALHQALLKMDTSTPPSRVERLLRPYQPRVFIVVRAALDGTPQAALVERYYKTWRHVTTALTGDDLRSLGLRPGPRYAVLLDALLAARLDGQVVDAAGERALLNTLLDTEPS